MAQYYYNPNFNEQQSEYMRRQIERDNIARKQKKELKKNKLLARRCNNFILGIAGSCIFGNEQNNNKLRADAL